MATTANISEKNVKEIHFDNLWWKSTIGFIESELEFIERMLSSYIFEPTTPNLFERLQEFKILLSTTKKELKIINEKLQKHENQAGGVLECDTISCTSFYEKEHQQMQEDFQTFYQNFNDLKQQILTYAGAILKKNKK